MTSILACRIRKGSLSRMRQLTGTAILGSIILPRRSGIDGRRIGVDNMQRIIYLCIIYAIFGLTLGPCWAELGLSNEELFKFRPDELVAQLLESDSGIPQEDKDEISGIIWKYTGDPSIGELSEYRRSVLNMYIKRAIEGYPTGEFLTPTQRENFKLQFANQVRTLFLTPPFTSDESPELDLQIRTIKETMVKEVSTRFPDLQGTEVLKAFEERVAAGLESRRRDDLSPVLKCALPEKDFLEYIESIKSDAGPKMWKDTLSKFFEELKKMNEPAKSERLLERSEYLLVLLRNLIVPAETNMDRLYREHALASKFAETKAPALSPEEETRNREASRKASEEAAAIQRRLSGEPEVKPQVESVAPPPVEPPAEQSGYPWGLFVVGIVVFIGFLGIIIRVSRSRGSR